MSRILLVYSLFFVVGLYLSAISEKRFFSLFSKERKVELGMQSLWKMFFLNPFWIFSFALMLPLVALFSPFGIWKHGPIAWLSGKASLQGLAQAQVICDRLTKEEIEMIVSTYSLSPEQVEELENTIEKHKS